MWGSNKVVLLPFCCFYEILYRDESVILAHSLSAHSPWWEERLGSTSFAMGIYDVSFSYLEVSGSRDLREE